MASIFASNMRNALDGAAMALKAAGRWDELLNVSIDYFSTAIRSGLVDLQDLGEDDCPYSWMFPEDFDELDQETREMMENYRNLLFRDLMMLLGRDLIAELNPGRSKGYIESIRIGFQPDEDGQIYSRKRLREFNEVIGVMEQRGEDHPLVEELCAAIEEAGRDFSHPAPDAVMTWALQRARSMTNDGIRERAAKGLQALQKRVKV